MSAAELATVVDALSRQEKLQLLQFLVSSIARDENIAPLDPSVVYPMWTPYNTPTETVDALEEMLTQDNHGN